MGPGWAAALFWFGRSKWSPAGERSIHLAHSHAGSTSNFISYKAVDICLGHGEVTSILSVRFFIIQWFKIKNKAFVCPSLCLSVCFTICLPASLSLSLSLSLYVCLSLPVSVCLSSCLSVRLSMSLSCLPSCLPACLSTYLSVCLFVCLFVCLSLSFCVTCDENIVEQTLYDLCGW